MFFDDDLGALEGRLRHCVRYKTGKGGRKVCAKYRAGPGRPKGRRKAGIKRRFYERSKTKKRASSTCLRWSRKSPKTGRKRCLKRRYAPKTRVVRGRRRPYRAKRKSTGRKRICYMRMGKRVCRKATTRRSTGTKRKRKSSGKRKRKSTGTAYMRSYQAAMRKHTKALSGYSSRRRRRR
jgi:hypothetical protein